MTSAPPQSETDEGALRAAAEEVAECPRQIRGEKDRVVQR